MSKKCSVVRLSCDESRIQWTRKPISPLISKLRTFSQCAKLSCLSVTLRFAFLSIARSTWGKRRSCKSVVYLCATTWRNPMSVRSISQRTNRIIYNISGIWIWKGLKKWIMCESQYANDVHIYLPPRNVRKYFPVLAVNAKVLLHTLVVNNNVHFENFFHSLYYITLL